MLRLGDVMSAIHVRPMIAADGERVAALCTQLGYPSTAAEVSARFAALAVSSEHAVFVAADDEDGAHASAPEAQRSSFDPPTGLQGRPQAESKGDKLVTNGARGAQPVGAGTVVGFVHVHQAATLEGGPWAEIGGLVIDEAARGHRIGQMLMEAAEQWAVERGYAEMRVRSNVIRQRAHEFYRRLGYEVIKTQVNFRKPLGRRGGQ